MKHQRFRSPLDELFADRPDTRPKMRWPVTDSASRVIEWHDDYWSAFDAVKNTNDRFIGEPVRDLGNDRFGVEI